MITHLIVGTGAALAATATAVAVTHETHPGCAKHANLARALGIAFAIAAGVAVLAAIACWLAKCSPGAALLAVLLASALGLGAGYLYSEHVV